ncbi:RNB-domain-containing protein [Amniculicola lignicola CBS 123094]|uniref:RNB-domain-containing protein n=1 Tax=Amniculicola lignicola CBS 123094 TaxID=1392246 RepID=A0A6A5WJK4_9PLEO|nr:RNB-domain-containing protein [Amniculicola lignicola CBS 123094]
MTNQTVLRLPTAALQPITLICTTSAISFADNFLRPRRRRQTGRVQTSQAMIKTTRQAAHICWECRLRIAGGRRKWAHDSRRNDPLAQRASRRELYTSQRHLQTASAAASAPPFRDPALPIDPSLSAKDRLAKWQELFGVPNPDELSAFENHPAHNASDIANTNAAVVPLPSQKTDQLAYDDHHHHYQAEDDLLNLSDGARLDDVMTISLFLKPGDVVELGRAGPSTEPTTAVFVRQLGSTSQYLTLAGRWTVGWLSAVSFVIPGVIDPALLRPIEPYLPTTEDTEALNFSGALQIPRELSTPVTDVLQALKDESEKIYRENATMLDSAYATLADQSRVRIMTITQVAKVLLGRNDPLWSPSPAKLLAVRKSIVRDRYRFVSDVRSARSTNVFSIRPKDDVEAMDVVHGWIREHSEHAALNATSPSHSTLPSGAQHVTNFVEKAHRLILQSRQWRDPLLGHVGPIKSQLPASPGNIYWGEEFTITDQRIISFMHAWAVTSQFRMQGPFHTAATKILELTGLYKELPHKSHTTKGEKNIENGFLFMQEIGVISPHENRTLSDEQLMLPTIRLTRNLELLNTKAELTRRNPDFKDSMAALRHDWQDMNIYCIDNVDAREIDDGISISPVNGVDSQRWVHIHVANPTAFFEKTHVLSALAAHMTETVYTVEGVFPMLPSWVSQNYFSIAPNRPVLTISARIDMTSGEVLERKIRPGVARNVVSMTYSELAIYLGEPGRIRGDRSITQLVVGEVFPGQPTPSRRTISSAQQKELQQLYEVAIARGKRRHARGAFSFTLKWSPEVRTFQPSTGNPQSWSPPSLERARFIRNDPAIEVDAFKVPERLTDEITSAYLVEELMILASAVAGDWCAERSIPVMYKGTIATPGKADKMPLQQFRDDVLSPLILEDRYVTREVAIQYLGSIPSSITHYAPIKHEVLALEASLKVTSPLRRFADMINHWQIEAALRRESQTGQKFNNKDTTTGGQRAILPFSQRQIQESIITLSPRERLIKTTANVSIQFWVILAIARSHYYGQGNFPKTFNVSIIHINRAQNAWLGIATDYGIGVDVMTTTADMFEPGDEWECRIVIINVYKRSIHVEPIRLVRKSGQEKLGDA